VGIQTDSGSQIQASIQSSNLVCVPFRSALARPNGLALTLGSYYYRTEQFDPATVHNPFDSEDNERYFEGPFHALTHQQQCMLSGIKPLNHLAPERTVILLAPGERIIAHTHEFIGVPEHMAGRLQALAGWQQSGVAITAISTDLSRVARLSISIQNTNQHKSIILPVGTPIVRLVLDVAAVAPSTNSDGAADGLGPFSSDLVDATISAWIPSSILAETFTVPAEAPATIEGLQYE
jgi:deoxycytidine triphosphate deaminase